MLHAWAREGEGLVRLAAGADLAGAIWIDLVAPDAGEVQAVAALGVSVPTLAEMEEIELSSRLYREAGVEVMTAVLPGESAGRVPAAGPVTFILGPNRLVTVRHHAPRPFETFPEHAARTGPGCADPDRLFLGLIETIVGRLADLIEAVGSSLEEVGRRIYLDERAPEEEALRAVLRQIGREGEQLGRVRLALLTVERLAGFHAQSLDDRRPGHGLGAILDGLARDIHALEVHADHLAARVDYASDATLGFVNLAQAQTTKIVSVVAVLFLPPTLIASVYGMNFRAMPELGWLWGYPLALLLMLASAAGTWLVFRLRRWL